MIYLSPFGTFVNHFHPFFFVTFFFFFASVTFTFPNHRPNLNIQRIFLIMQTQILVNVERHKLGRSLPFFLQLVIFKQ